MPTTINVHRLAEISLLGSSAGAVYTNPASTKGLVRLIVLHNTDASALVVSLWNVPNSGTSAGTAADGNRFFNESIPAGETISLSWPPPGLVLEDQGDSIQGKAATASKVTIQIYGFKEVTT